jgi:hypothetical protein
MHGTVGASALLSKEQATEDLYRTITRFLGEGICYTY